MQLRLRFLAHLGFSWMKRRPLSGLTPETALPKPKLGSPVDVGVPAGVQGVRATHVPRVPSVADVGVDVGAVSGSADAGRVSRCGADAGDGGKSAEAGDGGSRADGGPGAGAGAGDGGKSADTGAGAGAGAGAGSGTNPGAGTGAGSGAGAGTAGASSAVVPPDTVTPFDADVHPPVAVIIPVYNASAVLPETLGSVLTQTYPGPIQVCAYDDGSTDDSWDVLTAWKTKLEADPRVTTAFVSHESAGVPPRRGPGFGRNRAVDASTAPFLCFLDSDDVMHADRVKAQLAAARARPTAIVGSGFVRTPDGSTARYTDWANSLTRDQLYLQQYRELTVVQPTWFMAREVFTAIGGYDESPPPYPEDLDFFHRHLDRPGATLYKVDSSLVTYRYSEGSLSWQHKRRTLLTHRVKAFERRVLTKWDGQFSIWGVGRDGKQFFNALSRDNQLRVKAFLDINPAKVGTTYHNATTRQNVPIVHFSDGRPPIVMCVALIRDPAFQENVDKLGLSQGTDFWFFV